ncbi:1-aminocyclopropane-1-carboxylate oxidase 1-like isoform X2 [Phoenix dactylifera]|uniref:1-aminocyclopropane-1-carboxylate oxidase n=1 Tax=Phoenix dactylifera TaxID=42345 RepID=A0A8B9AUZ4_PHODC|nr:1-aminocyclopropane-1-carboxylate oxidase 1-like isoform X2 [Phoenix dactylifera]
MGCLSNEPALEDMAIPVINLRELDGERRTETMSLLHEACEKWGFFWVENHGINKALMEKVKRLVNSHYEEFLKQSFYESELAKELGPLTKASEVDWQSTYFIRHQPESNDVNDVPGHEIEFCKAMEGYIRQLIELAERLAEVMSENLGLEKCYLKKAFSPPFVGAEVAKYPQCPHPELVMGLRARTDAGGISLLLQDDMVPGLEFFKDGKWVPITPAKDNRIFVNLGDQVEVISNGLYKSILHRVVADKDGSRLSIATFYNPGANAIISPAPKLLYPGGYRFKDYLDYYTGAKFSDKGARFQTIKDMFK